MADDAYVTIRDQVMEDYRVVIRYVPDHPAGSGGTWVWKDGRVAEDMSGGQLGSAQAVATAKNGDTTAHWTGQANTALWPDI